MSVPWRLSTIIATTVIAASSALGAAPVQVSFPPPPPKGDHIVQSNFLGISIELSFLNVYFGNDSSTTPAPVVSYLGAVRKNTGSQPLRIRLGGNSMDSSTYVANQSNPVVVFTDPHANFNDQPIDFGEALFHQLKDVGDQTGGAEYTIGLSLFLPSDNRAPNVPAMAAGAKKILGDNLDTFLLGNEPDLYTGHKKRPNVDNYTVPIYIDEWETASKGLRNTSEGNLLARPVLGGPTICCAWDLATLIQQGYVDHVKKDLKYISLQHYPQNYCFDNKYKYEVDYYLKHNEVVLLAQWQEHGISLAAEQGIPIMMSEFNTASCGGVPKVSDTFAAGALWVIDYSLQLATVGYSAAYVHQREPGIVYNLFDAPLPAGTAGPWSTNPGFYALLVMPEILNGASGSRVIDLNLANSMWDGSKDLAAYAMYDLETQSINRIALFNYANATRDSEKTYLIPKEVFTNATSSGLAGVDPTQVTVKFLTAAHANEKFDISWAGKTYAGVGNGEPVDAKPDRPSLVILDCTNGCSVNVPGPGLAVVYIGGAATAKPNTSNSSNIISASASSQVMSASVSASVPTSTSATGSTESSNNNSAHHLGVSVFATIVAMFAALLF